MPPELPDFLQRHVDAGDLLRIDALALVQYYSAEALAPLVDVPPGELRWLAQDARKELRDEEGLPTPEEEHGAWRR